MRAICWNGVNDISTETVDDPSIVNPHDAILKVRLSTTCGSDLHFLDGYIPTMREGDVIGHEFLGEIVDVGPEVQRLKPGDRVVVPSFISCGRCWFCESTCSRCATTPTRTRRCRSPPWASPPAVSTATPTPSAATRARTRSTCGSSTPTRTASTCPRASAT